MMTRNDSLGQTKGAIYDPETDCQSDKNEVFTSVFGPYYHQLRSVFISPETSIR